MSLQSSDIKSRIKQIAQDLGFFSVGFSKADFLAEEAPRLENWLNKQQHGKMAYMENHFDMRLDPRLLVPGSKTVISFLYNYFPEQQQPSDTYQLSKYAYGKDYHDVIKNQLRKLMDRVKAEIGDVEGRIFVDSAPVLEKAWAKKSGLGWMGKNANLIHPKAGSFYFLAEWICDLDIEPDGPIRDYCGTCTRCIDACPTDAIVEPYVVDGSKCISYLTIELKDQLLPSAFKGKLDDWMYGCDICQDVCPWNRFSKPHNEPQFQPHPMLFDLTKNDWEDLTEELYRELFRGSAVKRAKFEGLKRNIQFIKTLNS
ncbi:MAG: tRNA epoxyqueuosine(34) reductase QueG [Fluviicola sp.]|nr:tRNA epoxyqueuosine(34) reductase QueG [Fluviicola sp.]